MNVYLNQFLSVFVLNQNGNKSPSKIFHYQNIFYDFRFLKVINANSFGYSFIVIFMGGN
jgi:hypothetical protein